MRTVSRELAEKLRDAGLVWELKPGDWAADDLWGEMGQVYISSDGAICLTADDVNSYIGSQELATWLPTLSDLLAELEALGYVWVLSSKYKMNICLRETLADDTWKLFSDGDTPEEAAGQALLWVLEQGKGERE